MVPFSQVKADDFLKQAALDIISILTNPHSTTTITLAAGDETHNTLLKVAHALKRAEQLPSLPNEQPSTPTKGVVRNYEQIKKIKKRT